MGNTMYPSGHTLLINNIGKQPGDRSDPGHTVVCVTANVNTDCCRDGDNSNGGALGDFLGPKGIHLTSLKDIGDASDIIYSVRYRHQLRLGRRGSPNGPFGEYKC